MKITCIGGGPAGLYSAILFAKKNPRHKIRVLERNPRGSTFGWGVVLSDETLSNMEAADAETAREIKDTLAHWDDIDVHFKGEVIRSSGHGFCGIGRQKLLSILEKRAESLGVSLEFGAEIDPEKVSADADLVIASDGIFSKTRAIYADFFKPDLDTRLCKFVWLGVKKVFPAFTFIFEETPWGWFQAHSYRFDGETSTFIVECPESVWLAAGIDKMSKEDGIAFCERLFAKYLAGERLISNAAHLRGSSTWINFTRVNNKNWHHKNIVLLGDAAATAHFSIGSGTKLAIESAMALTKKVSESWDAGVGVDAALRAYADERRTEVHKLQSAARNSTEWFENVSLHSYLEPKQFAYSLLTRSQRVSHENLRLRDKNYLEGYERWWIEKETAKPAAKAIPPMFVPLTLRSLVLQNRVAVSPMATYSAIDGNPQDFHMVHLGERALGGAGLIFTEMTCVSPEARITPGCAGLYSDEHTQSWKRIVNFVHDNSPAKIALQLGHAGPKGSTQVGWENMDEPLPVGNWPLFAPSAMAYGAANSTPKEMSRADMDKVIADFISAGTRAVEAGFDMLELHCAHGYLLSAFLSPLTNRRKDEYGGDIYSRARFPLEIFSALRKLWPSEKPMSVRISAVDWVTGGNTAEDAVAMAKIFAAAGADIIDVSSGQVSREQKPVYGRMFQTPFSDRIRAEARIKTMAVGNIYEPDHVNSILGAGRADLCLLARPHLADPHWTLRAAAELGYEDQAWPKQYLSAKRQLEANIARAKSQTFGEI